MKMFRSDIFIIIPSFSIIRYTQISSSTFLLPQSAGIHRYLHHHFFFLNHQVYTDIFIIIPSSSIIRYTHHQQTSTHDSTHINTSIEMGIAFWTNEIFENERNFSWKIASFRKKTKRWTKWNGSFREMEKRYFLLRERFFEPIFKKTIVFYLTNELTERMILPDFCERLKKRTNWFVQDLVLR